MPVNHMSVCPSVCLYVCLSIRLSIYPICPSSARLTVHFCFYVCLSIHMSVHIYPSVFLSLSLSIHLFVYPSVCPSFFLSIRLSPPPREIYAVLTVPESVRLPPSNPLYCPPSNMSHIYWDMAATFSLATQGARESHSSLIHFYKNKMLILYNRGDFGSASNKK
jgi:hypothetical protein